MKTNKIDKSIKEKLEHRTFTPSDSAWERLSVQLDETSKQKKFGWFFYASTAASILLLLSISIQFFSNDDKKNTVPIETVISPLDKEGFNKKIDKLINEVPIPDALVKKEEIILNKTIIHAPVIVNQGKNTIQKSTTKDKSQYRVEVAKVLNTKSDSFIKKSKTVKPNFLTKKRIKDEVNTTIKVNADDLLYAVTHTPEEVELYYAKYDVNREDVLKAIKNELKQSNIKINPNTILAEVERTIDDEFFENTFIKSLKRRVSDIALAIASRND